jgi:hypothetical protein
VWGERGFVLGYQWFARIVTVAPVPNARHLAARAEFVVTNVDLTLTV